MGVAVATEEVSPREAIDAGANAEVVAARARTERASFMVAFGERNAASCKLRLSPSNVRVEVGALSRVGHE